MTNVTPMPHSRVKIDSTVAAATVAGYRDQAIQSFKSNVKIDGFRPGTAPTNVVEQTVGAAGILEKMAELAIADAYPKILTDEKIDAIGRPVVLVTKLAPDNDLEFSVETDVMPKLDLGDYKKAVHDVASNPEIPAVTDDELDIAIRELRQMRAHQKMHDDGHDHDDHNHQNIPDDQLPEFNDEFVKTLSASFENVDDFKTKLRENMSKEKQAQAAEKTRMEIIDAVVAESTVDIPAVMTDFELDRMIDQFTGELSMSGMKFDDYLKMINKTREQLRTEWTDNANKRAKIQMIMDTLAERESIKPNAEELESEITKMMDMYRDHADIDENRVRAYVTQMMTNNAVLSWLQSQ